MVQLSISPVPDPQLFRDAFSASPIGIAVENLEGEPLFVNPAFCRFLGFTEEELRSKHCVDFSPREDAEKDWALFQQLKAGVIDHYQLDKRYFRRDGSLVWGRLSLSLLKGHSSPLVLGMVEDITDRKIAEESRFRHAAIVESSDDAIVSGTLNGIIVSWNAGAEKIYGYTEAEAVGKPITMLLPPELPNEEKEILERLRAGKRIKHFETVRVTKAGEKINVSLTISPIKDSSGRTVGISGIARDITERKRVEEAVRASEERLRLAQQAARLGMFERDVRTGGVTWSAGLESLYGLSPGIVGGKNTDFFRDLIHPGDRERVAHLIEHACRSGQPTEGEWRAIWPDGSAHWISGRWQVLMDESGEPSRVVGVNIDVTERKLAEDTLRGSEERLRLAQSAAHIGTFDLNLQTGVNIWQPETEALYGLPPGGFGGTLTAFEDLIHPDDRERVKGLSREMIRTGETTEGEWRVVWPDGSVHWIAARCQILTDASGERSRVIGVNMDVTERKNAEQALRANEELLKIFVKNVPAAVAMLDRDMRYLQVSDRWCTDYLAGPAQVLGRSHYELFPDMPERWKEIHRRALAGETLRADEDQWDGRDGPRWARWEVRPWMTAEGGVGGILILSEDITRRKQMEESLAAMSRKLIESQEQERTRIARELHDDINQRLALLSVELEASRQNPPGTAADMSIVLAGLRERINEISSDVQSMSHRLHSSQLEYLGIVAATRSFCREFAVSQKVEIDFHHDDIPRSVSREVSLCLFRVLQEALHNAVKYSQVRHFEVRLRYSENQLDFTVSDRGVGFDAESAASRGGLGLTSMRERVRLINGTISIESRPMHGTTIHIRVPVRAEDEPGKWAV